MTRPKNKFHYLNGVGAISSILLATCMLSLPISAPAEELKFKEIPTQFIATFTDLDMTSGNRAHTWGLWRSDPALRGVPLKNYNKLQAADGLTPENWTFDKADWWLDEYGHIVEKPVFAVTAGTYLVAGDRDVKGTLVIYPKSEDGSQRWELKDGVRLFDVIDLPRRSARYTPVEENSCTPANAPIYRFRITPGTLMPPVKGCRKKDYAVLRVIGVAEGSL